MMLPQQLAAFAASAGPGHAGEMRPADASPKESPLASDLEPIDGRMVLTRSVAAFFGRTRATRANKPRQNRDRS